MQPRTDLAMEAKALYERSAQEQTKLSGVPNEGKRCKSRKSLLRIKRSRLFSVPTGRRQNRAAGFVFYWITQLMPSVRKGPSRALPGGTAALFGLGRALLACGLGSEAFRPSGHQSQHVFHREGKCDSAALRGQTAA